VDEKMTNEADKIHYRCLENMYHSAPCNKYYSPKMIVSKGNVEISIQVKEECKDQNS